MIPASTLYINLGSGQRPFAEPWINVDINAKWNPHIVADGAHMPMFGDNSANLIVCHQTLEHYGCGEGAAMVQECWRVLKPGGSLIVTVPDMNALARGWIQGRITTQLFMTSVYGAYMDSEADRHRWSYTRSSLKEFLNTTVQWASIGEFDYRVIAGAGIAKDWWILATEAIK